MSADLTRTYTLLIIISLFLLFFCQKLRQFLWLYFSYVTSVLAQSQVVNLVSISVFFCVAGGRPLN